MGADSKIEWTHHTFNPWRGCTKVSQGCKHCYAETLSARNPRALGQWGPRGTRVIAAAPYWRQPLAWDKAAAAVGERHRVFCASLADVFEGADTMPAEAWPAVQAARERLFNLILETPHLDWLLLTKRPQNVTPSWGFHDNVWIGTSVEDQQTANERIPHLLRVPARVRFLSCEPLLGPVDLSMWFDPGNREWFDDGSISGQSPQWVVEPVGLHWVIVGGESGPNARPMHPDWARSLRDQCQAAGVPFFFKQHGEWVPYARIPQLQERNPDWDGNWTRFDGTRVHDMSFTRVGKRRAGRLLDGRTWDEVPS